MIAHAVYFQRLSIQKESFFHIETKRANACKSTVFVFQQSAHIKFGHHFVQIRTIDIPQHGFVSHEFLNHFSRFSRKHNHGCIGFGKQLTLRIEKALLNFHLATKRHIVFYNGLYINVGTIGRNAWRSDISAVIIHMHRVGKYKTHIAVNARPGVPARIGLLRIIDFHGNYILSAETNMRRKIVTK